MKILRLLSKKYFSIIFLLLLCMEKSTMTHKSIMNHSYVRKSENFKAPFIFFWANGDAHQFSKSELFFGNLNGEIWKLPYSMEKEYELPQKIE